MTTIIALMWLEVMSNVDPAMVLAFANFGFGSMPQLLMRDMML